MANESSTKPTYSAEELRKLAETVLDKYRLEEVYSRPDQIDAAETRFYAAATPEAILALLAELAHQKANVAEMYRDCIKAESELARVRGLLQGLIVYSSYHATCLACDKTAVIDAGQNPVHEPDCWLVKELAQVPTSAKESAE